ncbi:N-6 DNA methylase [Nocardiopsis rhodophaea]|uniref:N-6 DNA methylase n=1 Tax=Nocardiopsis rhodophaea TaxID=280238 RepID=UPI0031D8E678
MSNWRRRHADFPAPAGGTDSRPMYDLGAVREWLAERGQLPEESPRDRLGIVLHSMGSGKSLTTAFLSLLAAGKLDRKRLITLTERPDAELLRWSESATEDVADDLPGVSTGAVHSEYQAEPLRALLQVVASEGPEAATEVLAERLLEQTGATSAYSTPIPLAVLMADLMRDGSDTYPATVLDPASGNGSLLIAASRAGATKLFGQDLHKVQAAQSVVRLRLTSSDAEITVRQGDSLRADAFPELTADAVLCNPPYGVRDWGHDELAYDERWAYGVPPKGEPELAWLQHCLSHLVPGGQAVLLMPPAVAERAGARRIRSQLVRDGALRAVIALPQGSAVPLHVGLHLWVLQRPGGHGPSSETVLFVDATTKTATTSGEGVDLENLRDTVLSAWQQYSTDPDGFEGTPGTAQALPLIDLMDGVVDLTPARHVRAVTSVTSPAQCAQDVHDSRARLRQRADELFRLIKVDGWYPAGEHPREWRTATVADLLRGGALEMPTSTSTHSRRTRAGHSDHRPQRKRQGLPVLTVDDVTHDRSPSGSESSFGDGVALPQLEKGDVLLPEIVRSGTRQVARVVRSDEVRALLGPQMLLFRPDQTRLDPWFLAGFLSTEQNVNAATTGTSIVRIDPRRLRVPLLPLAEQQRYGAAFRYLHAVRSATRRAAEAAEETTLMISTGLTTGAVLPPDREMPKNLP